MLHNMLTLYFSYSSVSMAVADGLLRIRHQEICNLPGNINWHVQEVSQCSVGSQCAMEIIGI